MRPARFDGHDISEAWEMEEGERHCASAVCLCPFRDIGNRTFRRHGLHFCRSWLRGADLNRRPLGYECRGKLQIQLLCGADDNPRDRMNTGRSSYRDPNLTLQFLCLTRESIQPGGPNTLPLTNGSGQMAIPKLVRRGVASQLFLLSLSCRR